MGTTNTTKKLKPDNSNRAILDYSNGERYDGEVVDGMRNGFGTYFYKNGERFEGNWYKNLKHGRGTFFDKTGEVYEGMWNNNKKEGVGTYYYNNGERYYGEWKNDKKQGKGIINYGEGDKFIGQFKNNKKNGIGEINKKDGSIFYEEWLDGKLVRQSEKLKYAPGVKYDIDYNELNTGNFEKYLETKTKQQYESKLNQIKSKYFTLEFAKKLKSKNPENYYDSIRMIHNTNNIVLEKPDISLWKTKDVCDLFSKLGYGKYLDKINQNAISGAEILSLNIEQIMKIIDADTHDVEHLSKSLETLKKLNFQSENLKSMARNINSITKEKASEMIEEENNNKSEEQSDSDEEKKKRKVSFTDNQNEGGKDGEREENNINKDNNNIANNKSFTDLELMHEMTTSGMNFSSTVNLNGLNYFINYDELTLQMKVGEGGFGEVFQGVWNGKNVAIKKLTLKNSKFMDNLAKFINEINIISSLRHPNIVLYMGASIERDNYYMITDYLPKGSLFDYIHRDKGKITERDQISIAFEIAVALKYLHSRNVVHCDLKSSNILIDDNWKIKIGDFGLSKFFDKNNPEQNRGRIGTPHWMAPEILKGEKYEFSADIFSFGMILWEILSLEIPYYGINPIQVISLVADEKKIVKIPKVGHPVIKKLIANCLQYEASKRPNLDEIVNILEKLKHLNKYYGI